MRTIKIIQADLSALEHQKTYLAGKIDGLTADISTAKAELSSMLAQEATGRRLQSMAPRKDALGKMATDKELLEDALALLDGKRGKLLQELAQANLAEKTKRTKAVLDNFTSAGNDLAWILADLQITLHQASKAINAIHKRLQANNPTEALMNNIALTFELKANAIDSINTIKTAIDLNPITNALGDIQVLLQREAFRMTYIKPKHDEPQESHIINMQTTFTEQPNQSQNRYLDPRNAETQRLLKTKMAHRLPDGRILYSDHLAKIAQDAPKGDWEPRAGQGA
jgi:hypothetical protein